MQLPGRTSQYRHRNAASGRNEDVYKRQLYELCIHDTVRFGTLKKELPGITNTMLTNSLRELERDGFINRVQFNEIPPHVEYSFTERGRDLMPIFYQIMLWGFKHEKDNLPKDNENEE